MKLYLSGVVFVVGRLLSAIGIIYAAKHIGSDNFGKFAVYLTTIHLGVIFAAGGTQQVIINYVPKYQIIGNSFGVSKINSLGLKRVKWALIVISLGLCGEALFIRKLEMMFSISLLISVYCRSHLLRLSAFFQAFKHPILAQLPIYIIFNVSFLSFCILIVNMKYEFKLEILFYSHVISHVISLIISYFIFYRVLPQGEIRQNVTEAYDQKILLSFRTFFFLSVVAQLSLEAPIIIGTLFLSYEDIGLLKLSLQIAMVCGFGQQIINIIYTPYMSQAHKQKDLLKCQSLLTTAARISTVYTCILIILFICLGESAIKFVLGVDYGPAFYIISILLLGQFFNAVMGSSSLVFNVAEGEKLNFKVQSWVLCILAPAQGLSAFLYGIEGLVVLNAAGLSLTNIVLAVIAKKKLGLTTWLR